VEESCSKPPIISCVRNAGRNVIVENNIKIQIAFLIVVSIAFIVFMYMMVTFDKDGNACQQNPLNYGVEKLQQHFNNPITCSCIADNTIITFNDTQLKAEYI
jgi:hypothetical protein